MTKTPIDKLPRHYRRHLEHSSDTKSRRILVFDDQHGKLYFDANTVEQALQAYLYILLLRHGENGAWGNIRAYVSDAPEKPSFAEEDINNLPVELQPEARKALEQYTRARINHEQEVAQAEMVEKAIENRDAVLAFLYAHEQWGQGYSSDIYFEYVRDPKSMLEDME